MLPMECLYLSPRAMNSVAGQQPPPVKHTEFKHKPKSAVLRADLMQKCKCYYTFEKKVLCYWPKLKFVSVCVCLSVTMFVVRWLDLTTVSSVVIPFTRTWDCNIINLISFRILITWIIRTKSLFGLKLKKLWNNSHQILTVYIQLRGQHICRRFWYPI